MGKLAALLVLVGCGRVGFDALQSQGTPDAPPVCEADVDFTSDPNHCGRCGHSCLGGTCTASRCGSVMLASGQGDLRQIIVDDTHVYFVANGAVKRIVKETRAIETVATHAGTGFRMTQTEDFVFWVTRSGLVARAPKAANTTAELLATGQGDVGGIATDGDTVYWNTYPTQGSVYRQTIGDTNKAPVIGPLDNLTGMRIVGQTLYYLRANAGLFAVNVDGTGARTVQANVGSWEMAIDGDTVFLVNVGRDKIVRMSLTSGGPVDVAAANEPWGIALDDTHVYYANELGDTIARAPRSGGAAEMLATASVPVGIAVDEKAVYWTTRGGDVGMLAK